MATYVESLRIPRPIESMLDGLRLRIRAYVWVEGLAAVVMWLGGAFWIGLAVDWLAEPQWETRLVGLFAAAVGLVVVAHRFIARRAFVPLSRADMALLLERRFPTFGDRLLTTVELSERSDHAMPFSSGMLGHTAGEALQLSRQVRLRRTFNARRLAWRVVAAVAVAASIYAFAQTARQSFAFYIERLTGSPEPWPRDTLLWVEGFDTEFAVTADGASSGDAASSGSTGAEVHVFAGAVSVATQDRSRESRRVAAGAAARVTSGVGPPSASDRIQSITPRRRDALVRPIDVRQRIAAPVAAEGLATLRRAVGCAWSDDTPVLSPGARLSAGRYELSAGTAELAFNGGTLAIVEGPATFHIRSSHAVVLEAGKLLVRVPARTARFTVETPAAPDAPGTIVATERNDTLKVVRGADAKIVVAADAFKTIPKMVEIRYRTAGGGYGREILEQQSTAIAGQDEFQKYSFTFKNVLASIDFDVLGGDDRVRGLHLQAVDSPKFLETIVFCEYPGYLVDRASGRFTPRELVVGGAVDLPQGTNAVLRALANAPLAKVEIKRSDRDEPTILEFPSGRTDADRFELPIGVLNQNMTLWATLVDADGIANREPIPIEINVVMDQPPAVALRLRGVGSAITPDAVLPIEGDITDDYGAARGWFAISVGEKTTLQHPFAEPLSGRRKTLFASKPNSRDVAASPAKVAAAAPGSARIEALDLRTSFVRTQGKIGPGSKIVVSLKAADACNLGPAPHVGESDRYHLDVVTPEELLALLESRELALRQKFEIVIDELTRTRDTLVVAKTPPTAAPTATATPPGTPIAGTPIAGTIVERAVQNAERSAHETLGLAAAFEEIRDELVNNRLDTEQRRQRIEVQIAAPLRRIGEERFGRLLARLEDLRRRVAAEEPVARDRAALAALGAAKTAEAESLAARIAAAEKKLAPLAPVAELAADSQRQTDEILAEMRAVLGKMLELEDFNKLVDTLRELIKQQEALNRKTLQRQRDDVLR